MGEIKNCLFVKIVAILLIFTFLNIEISWSDSLASQSLFQYQMMTESAERFRASVLSEKGLLDAVFSISRYLLGDPEEKTRPLPLSQLETIMRQELGTALPTDVDLSNILLNNNVVVIPYTKDNKKYLIQITLRDALSAKELIGYEWIVSDKYVVKIMTEGYKEEPIAGPGKDVQKTQVTISEPIKTAEPSRASIRAIFKHALLLVLLFPAIAFAGQDGSTTGAFSQTSLICIGLGVVLAGGATFYIGKKVLRVFPIAPLNRHWLKRNIRMIFILEKARIVSHFHGNYPSGFLQKVADEIWNEPSPEMREYMIELFVRESDEASLSYLKGITSRMAGIQEYWHVPIDTLIVDQIITKIIKGYKDPTEALKDKRPQVRQAAEYILAKRNGRDATHNFKAVYGYIAGLLSGSTALACLLGALAQYSAQDYFTGITIGLILGGVYLGWASARYFFVGRATYKALVDYGIPPSEAHITAIAKSNGYRHPAFQKLSPQVQKLISVDESVDSSVLGLIKMLFVITGDNDVSGKKSRIYGGTKTTLFLFLSVLIAVTIFLETRFKRSSTPPQPPQQAEDLSNVRLKEIEKLFATIKRGDIDSRGAAAKALGEKGQQALQYLIKALKSSDTTDRGAALFALGKICNPETADAVIEALQKERDRDLRLLAIAVVMDVAGERGVQPIISAFEEAIKNRDRLICDFALVKLTGKDEERRIQFLIQVLLKDYGNDTDNAFAYSYASGKLAEVGDSAIPPLVEEMGRGIRGSKKTYVIFALTEIGTEKAVKALTDISKTDPDEQARGMARAALRRIRMRSEDQTPHKKPSHNFKAIYGYAAGLLTGGIALSSLLGALAQYSMQGVFVGVTAVLLLGGLYFSWASARYFFIGRATYKALVSYGVSPDEAYTTPIAKSNGYRHPAFSSLSLRIQQILTRYEQAESSLKGIFKILPVVNNITNKVQTQKIGTVQGPISGLEEEGRGPKFIGSDQTDLLFALTESTINNRRANLIALGEKLRTFLISQEGQDSRLASLLKFLIIKKDELTAKIKTQLEEILTAVATLCQTTDMEESETIRKNIHFLEPDSIVASMMVLARRAERAGSNLVIGLDTSWIPGYQKGTLQHNAINSLVREIESVHLTLRSMGVDNVEVISRESDEPLEAWKKRLTSRTDMANVFIFGSKDIVCDIDNMLVEEGVPNEKRPFLAGIDSTNLQEFYDKYGEAIDKQLLIQLVRMLSIAVELAAGKDIQVPDHALPIIVSYNKLRRIVDFLPEAKTEEYSRLQNSYRLERDAFRSSL